MLTSSERGLLRCMYALACVAGGFVGERARNSAKFRETASYAGYVCVNGLYPQEFAGFLSKL